MAVNGEAARPGGRRAAVAGLVGAAAATVAMAIVHTLAVSVPFPPLVIAQSLVRVAPGGFATFFIDLLGHWALRLAVAGASGVFLLFGAVAGLAMPWLERRIEARWGDLLAGALAFLPLWAAMVALYPPGPGSVSRAAFAAASLPVLAAGGFGAGWARRRLAGEPGRDTRLEAGARPGVDLSRRYLLGSLWWGTAGVLLGVSGLAQLIHRRPDPGAKLLAVPVRAAAVRPPAAGDALFARIPGLVPEVTPLADFYVVDEEIIDPDIDPVTWRLSVGGLTDRPLSLTYDALKRLPLVERFQTLECISNPTGGHLISNADWVGVPLPAILDRAGVRPGAVEVVFRCAGAYSESLTIEQAIDETTLVAIGMNGHVLPRAHGFPARILSVGTYGMKNPKWLQGIEVVDRPYQGFWERRGWSKTAVVNTMSRIDTPTSGAQVGGPVQIGGIAFAGDRGISKVEVSLDRGITWRAADLKNALSPYTWRLWRSPFDGHQPGTTLVLVRGYDGSGAVQTYVPRPPHPSGATGYDAISIVGANGGS